MENAIQSLVKVYLKSTKGKEFLGKKEFQNLVTTQLSNILSDSDSNDAVNNMAQGLDSDQDGKVGFPEYMKLVGYLAVSLNEQRNLANENPEQNAAAGQKEEEKPGANEEPKAEATAGAKVEANADAKAEAKAEGETQPEPAKEEPAAAVEVVEVAVKEEVETVKVEEAAEKPPAAAEEEAEKTTDEAAS